jgi:hypothetical protein
MEIAEAGKLTVLPDPRHLPLETAHEAHAAVEHGRLGWKDRD